MTKRCREDLETAGSAQERRTKVSGLMNASVGGPPACGPFFFQANFSAAATWNVYRSSRCIRVPVTYGHPCLPAILYIRFAWTRLHLNNLVSWRSAVRRRQWGSVKFKLEFHEVSRSTYAGLSIGWRWSRGGHNRVEKIVLWLRDRSWSGWEWSLLFAFVWSIWLIWFISGIFIW